MKSIALLLVSFFVIQSIKADDYRVRHEQPYWSWGNWDAVDADFLTNELACQSGPVKDDPKGNWGELTNRAQASIRFPKDTYTNGEPIITTILIRNYSTNETLYIPCNIPHAPLEFVILYNGTNLPPIPKGPFDNLTDSTLGDAIAKPLEQARFKQGIDSEFNLRKSGTYIIYGYDNVGQLDYARGKKVMFRLMTGKATIHIAPSANEKP